MLIFHNKFFNTSLIAWNRYWSRSKFMTTTQYDTLVNNMSKTFNNVLLHTRTKPIINMLENIRLYMMKRWATNKLKIQSYSGSICLKIMTRLWKESDLTKYWIPRYYGLNLLLGFFLLFFITVYLLLFSVSSQLINK